MTTDPFGKLVDHLESEVNWKKIFGVVDSVYSDGGFTSNADNFPDQQQSRKQLRSSLI